jgi:hypothetical protein
MDPLTLAIMGGAATIGSTLLNSNAQAQVDAARNAVITQDQVQQAALDAQAKQITDHSLGLFNNFGAQQTADATKLGNYFNTAPAAPTDPTLAAAVLPASTNAVVNRDIASRGATATAFGQQQGTARGNLMSFGDLMGNIGRSQALDSTLVGQLGNFKQGDTNVTNIALDNANRAGNTDAAIGNILGGVGKVGLTAAFSGKLAPGDPDINPDGSISGALGPTSINGGPLMGLSPADSLAQGIIPV